MGDKCIVMLRTVPGPQQEAFTEEGIRTFERSIYTLTADSNRMACKLAGPGIETVHGSDIISDGIVEGSVQVASDGMPIVMLADHQTTGGYAKIGTVISTDKMCIRDRYFHSAVTLTLANLNQTGVTAVAGNVLRSDLVE